MHDEISSCQQLYDDIMQFFWSIFLILLLIYNFIWIHLHNNMPRQKNVFTVIIIFVFKQNYKNDTHLIYLNLS